MHSNTDLNLSSLLKHIEAMGHDLECPCNGDVRIDGVNVTATIKNPDLYNEESLADAYEILIEGVSEVQAMGAELEDECRLER